MMDRCLFLSIDLVLQYFSRQVRGSPGDALRSGKVIVYIAAAG